MFLDFFKSLMHYMVPQQALTTLAGFLANATDRKVKNYLIQRFIHQYQVNMNEALIEDPDAYACFNDFFIRHLKPECRPIAHAGIVSPVDGCISEIGSIEKGRLIQAKGHFYTVAELLACSQEQAAQFNQGCFATLYLSPKDYHRVHMPLDAIRTSMTYIPGALFSVQPSSARIIPKLFARNERAVIFFSTQAGPMAMVLVGATIVGAIGTRWHGELKRSKSRMDFEYKQPIQKMLQGEEMGYFKLGSTVILLFAEGTKVRWDNALSAGSVIRFGEAMGGVCSNPL